MVLWYVYMLTIFLRCVSCYHLRCCEIFSLFGVIGIVCAVYKGGVGKKQRRVKMKKSKRQIILDNFKNETYLWSQTPEVNWWIYPPGDYIVVDGKEYDNRNKVYSSYYRVVWTWPPDEREEEYIREGYYSSFNFYYFPQWKLLREAYKKKHPHSDSCGYYVIFSILEKNGDGDELHLRYPNSYERRCIREALKRYGF